MLLPKKRRKTKVINVLLLKNVENENKKYIIIKAEIIAKYYCRKNITNENYKILLSGNKKNIIIRNILYKTYNINEILLSGKYYKRKL